MNGFNPNNLGLGILWSSLLVLIVKNVSHRRSHERCQKHNHSLTFTYFDDIELFSLQTCS